MPIPHFTQVKSHGTTHPDTSRIHEPVYPSLFELTFILPNIIQNQGHDPILLLENATSITGIEDVTKSIAVATQRFKYSTRKFVTMPNDTSLEDIGINFNVNVKEEGDVYNYNTLRAWYDLVWNSQNGTLHYKREIVGTIIMNLHDKKGIVIRRLTFHNVQIRGISGYEGQHDWENNEQIIQSVTSNFASDYWTDEFIAPDATITDNPNIYTTA